METLKFLLEEIGQRILQFCVDEGLVWLADALGVERMTLAFFFAIPGVLILLGLGIYKRLTRNRADGISPGVTPEREAP